MYNLKFLYALLFILIFSCSGTSYWKIDRISPIGGPNTAEIQISDSTFTICSYDKRNNRGDIQIFNSEFLGDTLIVYEIYPINKIENSETWHYQRRIIFAFLRKGKGLYPIYWKYPPIYPKADFKYFYNEEDSDYLGKLDHSRVSKSYVNWTGADSTVIYMDMHGIKHKKGKDKKLRKIIDNQNNLTDSTLWEIKLPTNYINDTTISQIGWFAKHGTLQSKKGKFVNLR
mgnify:CR=1 FL=1